jgi:hypothetical protein
MPPAALTLFTAAWAPVTICGKDCRALEMSAITITLTGDPAAEAPPELLLLLLLLQAAVTTMSAAAAPIAKIRLIYISFAMNIIGVNIC